MQVAMADEVQSCPRRLQEFGPWDHKENLDTWEERGNGYRQCSFCGGMHPEDAIKFVTEGKAVDPTTKPYKRYILGVSGPGKLYVMHFSDDQVKRFNAALRSRVVKAVQERIDADKGSGI